MNILQMLFGKQSEPPTLLEQLKENVSGPPHEAWKTLEQMGYTMIRTKMPGDKAGKSSYCIVLGGVPVCGGWWHNFSHEGAVKMREAKAQAELKRLQEASK